MSSAGLQLKRHQTVSIGFTDQVLSHCGEDVSADQMSHITIAYEPVWAIGTGKTATPEDADSAHAFIRDTVKDLYNNDIAENLIIQYGGSVKANNVKALMAKENIDGALVGGASLSVDLFLPIITFDK